MAVAVRGSALRNISAGIFLTAVLPGGSVQAQTAQQLDWCRSKGSGASYEQQISGCTAVIRSSRTSKRELHWAYHVRGYAYYRTDNFEAAVVDFGEAIRISPDDAHALNGRCWMRTIIGRELREALDDCNESLRLRAKDAATLDSRGFVCLKLGQINHAIADYDEALALDPNQAESHFGRGVAKLQRGEKDAGQADITIAKALKPSVVEQFAKYGVSVNGVTVTIAPEAATRADCARAVAQGKGAGSKDLI